jgi:hypothetical protein
VAWHSAAPNKEVDEADYTVDDELDAKGGDNEDDKDKEDDD